MGIWENYAVFLSREKVRIVYDQIQVLVNRELKLKYNSTALGYIWSLLNPVLQSLVYYVIFKQIIRFDLPNYLVFVLSGVFLWQFFTNVVIASGVSFFSNGWLIKKTAVPSILLVCGTFFTEVFHFILTFPVLLIAMCLSGIPFTWNLLLLPYACICIGLFSFGVALFYATINIFFRDLERIVLFLFQIWMFLCPVMIPIQYVPEKYQVYFDWNPMTPFLNMWRSIFYDPGIVDFYACGVAFLLAVAVVAAGYSVYHMQENKFAEMM